MTKKKISSFPPTELGEKVTEFSRNIYENLSGLAGPTQYGLQQGLDLIRRYVPDSELDEAMVPIAKAFRELSDLCEVDPLTGLPNRRALDDYLKKEFLSARRTPHHPIAFMMIDVDHFKDLNDTYGHAVGDVCLRLIGHVFREHEYFPSKKCSTGLVRETDYVARWGGEEFSVLLSKVSSGQMAYDVADRIRRTLEARTRNKKWLRKALNQLNIRMPGLRKLNGASAKFYQDNYSEKFGGTNQDATNIELHFREFPPYTVSIGVAFYDPTVEPVAVALDNIRHAADKSLYKSKSRGRNQVTLWRDPLMKAADPDDTKSSKFTGEFSGFKPKK